MVWTEAITQALGRSEQYRNNLAAAKTIFAHAQISYISVVDPLSDSDEELPFQKELYKKAEVFAAAARQPVRRGRPARNAQRVQGDGHRVQKLEAQARP
jgi:hypothetical protein